MTRPITPEEVRALAAEFAAQCGSPGFVNGRISFTPAQLSRFINASVAQLQRRQRDHVVASSQLFADAADLAQLLHHQFVTVEHALAEWAEREGLDDLRRRATAFVADVTPPQPTGSAEAPRATAGMCRVLRRTINGASFLQAVAEEGDSSNAWAMLVACGVVEPGSTPNPLAIDT